MKFKVRVQADMEFEIESEDENSINGDASVYVDNHREKFNWEFDYYTEIE